MRCCIISWSDYRNGSSDIYAQRISNSGVSQWTANGIIISNATNDQFVSRIISDDLGGAIITWSDFRNGSDYDIYSQRINSSGIVQWAINGVGICTAPENQVYRGTNTVVSDGAGGAFFVWDDLRNGGSINAGSNIHSDIYAQKINAAGAFLWPLNGIPICTQQDGQTSATMTSDHCGGVIIVWTDERNGVSNPDVYAQRVNGNGMAQWAENGIVISNEAHQQYNPAISWGNNGDAVITWADYRNTSPDIYAQNVNADGTIGIVPCEWRGTTNNDWFNVSNWRDGVLPYAITNTIIPSNTVNQPVINGNGALCQNLIICNGSSLEITGSSDLAVSGKLINNSNFNASSGTITLNGNGIQTVGGAADISFYNLTVNKPSSYVSLNTNATINGILGFSSGKISIDNSNLVIGSAGSITGASANNYIIATGPGSVIQQVAPAGLKVFPVGSSVAYTPVTIGLGVTSTADNFSARVLPSLYSKGDEGNPVTSNAVNNTWLIAEENTAGSDATITLQWPSTLELSGFNRSVSRLGHYKDGAWDIGLSDIIASGSDPYTITRSGITSFSPFAVVGNNFALPVTWLEVKGYHKNGDNYIEWSTASEQKTGYFEIEYSKNGTDFSALGQVTAAGNSTTIRHYNYVHSDIYEGLLYYRIKQVDMDGYFNYSKIIRISTPVNSISKLSVSPNPVAGMANIQINAGKSADVFISITNLQGELVYSLQRHILSGDNTISVDLSRLANGIYQLKLNDGKDYEHIRKIFKRMTMQITSAVVLVKAQAAQAIIQMHHRS